MWEYAVVSLALAAAAQADPPASDAPISTAAKPRFEAKAKPARSPSPQRLADEARLQECLKSIDADAALGFEAARAWAAETGVAEAYYCAAQGEIARERPGEGARQLETLALLESEPLPKAALLAEAGNAWLLAGSGDRARTAFDRALALVQPDPDLLIDRARAFALLQDYRRAEEDLSAALDLRAGDALALRLRAQARLKQNVFALAEKDAEDAVRIDPKNIDGLLVLGHAREAKRTGQAPQ